ncbi:MAG: hypothetical protein R2716_04800 [Microthrixaceae bacterium]
MEDVVRLGHVLEVTSTQVVCEQGAVAIRPGALVVHCAATGLGYPPVVPIWGPDAIRPQTTRARFPCFCAALEGYVEATRQDDRERNHLCPPNAYSDTPFDWARMQVRGTVASRRFGAEPDIAAWADECALNPARVGQSRREDPGVRAAATRASESIGAGLGRMAELCGEHLEDADRP